MPKPYRLDAPTPEMWYSFSLSEYERYELIGNIPHATEYGLSRVYGKLPRAAVLKVIEAHEREFSDAATQDEHANDSGTND